MIIGKKKKYPLGSSLSFIRAALIYSINDSANINVRLLMINSIKNQVFNSINITL